MERMFHASCWHVHPLLEDKWDINSRLVGTIRARPVSADIHVGPQQPKSIEGEGERRFRAAWKADSLISTRPTRQIVPRKSLQTCPDAAQNPRRCTCITMAYVFVQLRQNNDRNCCQECQPRTRRKSTRPFQPTCTRSASHPALTSVRNQHDVFVP